MNAIKLSIYLYTTKTHIISSIYSQHKKNPNILSSFFTLVIPIRISMKATKPRIPHGAVEVVTYSIYGRNHDLVDRYGPCLADDHEYVPFVVITICYFHHS